jgi:hypothetical protein
MANRHTPEEAPSPHAVALVMRGAYYAKCGAAHMSTPTWERGRRRRDPASSLLGFCVSPESGPASAEWRPVAAGTPLTADGRFRRRPRNLTFFGRARCTAEGGVGRTNEWDSHEPHNVQQRLLRPLHVALLHERGPDVGSRQLVNALLAPPSPSWISRKIVFATPPAAALPRSRRGPRPSSPRARARRHPGHPHDLTCRHPLGHRNPVRTKVAARASTEGAPSGAVAAAPPNTHTRWHPHSLTHRCQPHTLPAAAAGCCRLIVHPAHPLPSGRGDTRGIAAPPSRCSPSSSLPHRQGDRRNTSSKVGRSNHHRRTANRRRNLSRPLPQPVNRCWRAA